MRSQDPGGNTLPVTEYQDDDGGCYVAIFAGPAAEQRAQDYFQALQTGRLRTIRGAPSH